MDILKSLMGNKSILNGALGMLRNAFFKEGISAVFITPSDEDNSDTPGLKIQSYAGPVAVLTGEELEEVQEYFRIRSMYKDAPGYFLFMAGKLTYFPNSIEARSVLNVTRTEDLIESAEEQAIRMEKEKEVPGAL